MTRCFLVLAFTFSSFFLTAQHEWQVQSILQGNSTTPESGFSPAGYRIQAYTPSVSFKVGYSYETQRDFRIGFGLLFQNNRYKSSIVIDHPVDSIGFFGMWSVLSSYFNTPYVEVSYAPPILKKKLRATVGVRYKYSKSPTWGISTSSVGVGPDSVAQISWGRTYVGIDHSPWSLYTQLDYEIEQFKRFRVRVGVFYTYLQSSSMMVNEFDLLGKKYLASYKLRNDFFGMNLGIAYLSKKPNKNPVE